MINKFKQFLNLFKSSIKNIQPRIEPQLASKVINLNLSFSNNETREDFEQKIAQIIQYELGSTEFLGIFKQLVGLNCSSQYPDIIMRLVNKIDGKDIQEAFKSLVSHDNLCLCEVFLNHTDEKYKNILTKKNDYIYYLSLSIASEAHKVTEYCLKNNNFSSLLTSAHVGQALLETCLLNNNTEIAHMLLSHNINLSAFKEKDGSAIKLENNNLYKPDVIKQIQKKLLHDQLKTNLTNDKPTTTKRPKL